MNIAGFLALISMLAPIASTALAEAQPQPNTRDYFTQERYIENISFAPSGARMPEMTGGDAFLSSSDASSPASKKTNDIVTVSRRILVTAYSSSADQTDATPFIMASGKHVYDGAIAANFLPFGTLVKLPELFADKIFTVEDRMHERFSDRMDVWMPTRQEAINFGTRVTRIEIIR